MGVIRDVDKLTPELAKRTRAFLAVAQKTGLQIVIVETLRLPATQRAYYAQGRESLEDVNELRVAAGLPLISAAENARIVTKTLQSRHFGGNAVDIAPVKNGRVWWTAPQEIWQRMGELAESCGLDWCAGGYGQVWGKGWDNPHFELMK